MIYYTPTIHLLHRIHLHLLTLSLSFSLCMSIGRARIRIRFTYDDIASVRNAEVSRPSRQFLQGLCHRQRCHGVPQTLSPRSHRHRLSPSL